MASILQEKEASDAQSISFSKIPVIDLANIKGSDDSLRQALAKEIRDACINVGFFYVKNHGIPADVINEALEGVKEFFALPIETKMELDKKKTPNFRGYTPVLGWNVDPDNAGDLRESFEFGWEELIDDEGARGENIDGPMSGTNVWPPKSEAPEFREAVLKYYRAAVHLGRLMFPLFALALELPEEFFQDKTKHAAAIMGVQHYPPQTGQVDDRVMGIGAHTDWQCFTILWQEPGIQALQVLNAVHQWVNAPPVDGTLVVNLGDQFARWTNDVFKSTIHRVTNRSGVHRYSIPLFFGTDYNVRLEAIPSCVSETRPAKYEVVTAGEYVKSRFQAALYDNHA